MGITYTWSISGVDGFVESGELKNVARAIHWRCAGVYDEDSTFSNSRNGFVVINEPTDPQIYIPYEELTERRMLGWVFEKINRAEIEAQIAESLKYAPTIAALGPARTALPFHWKEQQPVESPVVSESEVPSVEPTVNESQP